MTGQGEMKMATSTTPKEEKGENKTAQPTIDTPVLKLGWHPAFMSGDESRALFEWLWDHAPWETPYSERKRISVMYGDAGLTYTVRGGGGPSGRPPWEKVRTATIWPDELRPLKQRLEAFTGKTFPVCITQLYPNGSVGILPHHDKEMAAGLVAGVSLYEDDRDHRDLVWSYRGRKYAPMKLSQGSLYIMYPPTNVHCLHTIAEDETIQWPRISLTFREK